MIIAITAIAAIIVIIIPVSPTLASGAVAISEEIGAARARRGSAEVSIVQSRVKTRTQTDILFRVFLNVILQFIVKIPSEKCYFFFVIHIFSLRIGAY